MKKQLKRILSILCAIALLISGMTFALAEETDTAEQEAASITAEEAADLAAAEEAAAAAKAAEEAAAAKKAAEEAAAAKKAAEEAAAAKAAEEAAAAKKAAEEAAAAKAAEEAAAAKAAEEAAAAKAAEEAAATKAAEEAAAAKAAEEAAAENTAEGTAAENDAEQAEVQAAEEADPEQVNPDQQDTAENDDPEEENEPDQPEDDEETEEDTSEDSDELNIRKASLAAGSTLSDTLLSGEELIITLKSGDASVVELNLYSPSGSPAISTKVNGKAVNFTPVDSDLPSMNLCTYELTNTAGRSREIVLTSSDTVSFTLTAVVKQTEETAEVSGEEESKEEDKEEDHPAAEANEETPAEGASGENHIEEKPAVTSAPTIQTSVKTYGALKAGSSISDALIAGQKAKIQVKCGKNLNITLTLKGNLNDMHVTIDGQNAQFIAAGNGTYTCSMDDVAFRKFSVVIAAKQDLAFTLSAAACQTEEAPAEETKEEVKEESSADINEATEVKPAEEEEEEPAEDNKKETAEKAPEEVTGEQADSEDNEETSEEDPEAAGENEAAASETADGESAEEKEESEEVKEETEEASEKAGDEADEEDEASEETEETEETEEPEASEVTEETDESEEAGETEETEESEEADEIEETEETAEENENEQTTDSGCVKVIVTAEEGADLYAEADRAAEVTGHLDAGTEIRVILNEDQTWGQICSADEEAAVQFISMEDAAVTAEEEAEEDKEEEPLTDEQLEELGYRKVQVLNENGADIYGSTEEEAAVTGHADYESELWIKDAEAEGWAVIYTAEEEKEQFVRLDEIGAQLSFEEQMLANGYCKAQVAPADGADIYSAMDEESEVIAHLDAGTEIWIKVIRETEWAEVYTEEEGQEQYIRQDAVIITLKPEGEEEDLAVRSVTASSSIEGAELVYYGTPVTLNATLEGFQEDDVYTVQWMYSPDNGETYYDLEDANELQYVYVADAENLDYRWRIVITLLPKE